MIDPKIAGKIVAIVLFISGVIAICSGAYAWQQSPDMWYRWLMICVVGVLLIACAALVYRDERKADAQERTGRK